MAGDFYFGVDLGTTNSCIAVASSNREGTELGKVQILETRRMTGITQGGTPEIQAKSLLPSCVYYRERSDGSGNFDVIVGEFAKTHYEIRPDFVARSIKSQMGEPEISNMSSSIPDKTPEEVSARILKSIFDSIKTQMKREIHDAIITVPASFGVVQREATLRAAEEAGICIKNSDGSLREILLSEPEAVIYNLINEAKNNMLLSDGILDFSKKLNMLVFDIGGGTLDITFHQVERSEENQDRYIVSTDATNRYTRLAGDDFDKAIAEVMFDRYLDKSVVEEARTEIKTKKESFVLKLMPAAENLKMNINEAVRSQTSDGFDSLWDDESVDERLFDTSALQKEKYSYYDSFYKKDIEDILQQYMGSQFTYEDYKNVEQISEEDQKNIIYPILYVLKEASKNLGIEDITVDAVVLNGGMSRFYMVKDRIQEFFGLEPLCVTDPDLSVARGAAIYRFYKRAEMPVVKEAEPKEIPANTARPSVFGEKMIAESFKDRRLSDNASGIYTGTIRNPQSLYVSATYGNKVPIIKNGDELPYVSPPISGFTIAKDQDKIQLPICEDDGKGGYRIIASGIGSCMKLNRDTYVSVVFKINRNKVLTFEGKRSSDFEGFTTIENISIKVDFSRQSVSKNRQNKLIAPAGLTLNVRDILHNFEEIHNSGTKNKSDKIKYLKQQIVSAVNKDEFALPVLERIKSSKNINFTTDMMVVARKISDSWSDEDIRKLRKECCSVISAQCNVIKYFGAVKNKANINLVNQSLLTLGTIGVEGFESILDSIDGIKDEKAFTHSCLNFYANIQVNSKWIYSSFQKSLKENKYIQQTVWAAGIVFRRNGNIAIKNSKELVDNILKVIVMENRDTVNVAIMALGLVCDQRESAKDKIEGTIIETALNILESLSGKYESTPSYKAAYKMINGIELSLADESYLLGYINPDAITSLA